MEAKELRIETPDGYEIDRQNSTFECIKFKPKLAYGNVAYSLFSNNCGWYISSEGRVQGCLFNAKDKFEPNNGTSKKQLEKLLAINKLMNVAKYLNGDWKPNWEDLNEYKFYIYMTLKNDTNVTYTLTGIESIVYFRSAELAQQAIAILGKGTIKLAHSTDW